MDIPEMWQEAMKTTRIRRKRLASLETFVDTRLPYVLISENPRLPDQSNIRHGHVELAQPKLFLPEHHPMFEGFDFGQIGADENSVQTIMYVRGIRLPSVKYKNRQEHQVYDGTVDDAIAQYGRDLARSEDTETGLITSRDALWPFALVFYVSMLVTKNLPKDIERLLEKFHEDLPPA